MNIRAMNHPFDVGVANIIKEKGLKYVYVAEKAGYTKTELSDMVNGRRIIKAHDILRISIALGVTADDIYAAGTGISGKPEKEVG